MDILEGWEGLKVMVFYWRYFKVTRVYSNIWHFIFTFRWLVEALMRMWVLLRIVFPDFIHLTLFIRNHEDKLIYIYPKSTNLYGLIIISTY